MLISPFFNSPIMLQKCKVKHTCASAQSSSTCLISYSSLSCSIWDVRTQQVARSIPTSSAVSSIEVTGDEEHIVLAQDDKVHDLL